MRFFLVSATILSAALLACATASAQPASADRSAANAPAALKSSGAQPRDALKQHTDGGRESIGYADQERREAEQATAHQPGR
jgi:hypothetical protein